ncbi:MAG: hypothetical protein JXB13_20730 [Phycisphaerae bacterium]|nr:hypothetical protein [Phycisphaerae bacterium]
MDHKQLDHAYHRSRVDAHIGGSVVFIFFLLALTFLVGDKFEPFQQGASFWEPTLLTWRADSNAWIPARGVLDFETSQTWQRRPASCAPEDASPETPPTTFPAGAVARTIRSDEGGRQPKPNPPPDNPITPTDEPGAAEHASGHVEPGMPADSEAETPKPAPAPSEPQAGTQATITTASHSPIITKELYPGVYSLVVVLGSLFAAYFLYRCAQRQARLMLSVYPASDPKRPYDRPWSEIRITFWALFVVLIGVLFLFLM